MKWERKAQIDLIRLRIKDAMESLISMSRCRKSVCDRAVFGALYRAMALRKLDHWLPSRMQGVAGSTNLSLPKLSSLLSNIRADTVATSGTREITGRHQECSPWTMEDENFGHEGTAMVYALVFDYAADLNNHAQESGLDPELPSASRLDVTSSPLFS